MTIYRVFKGSAAVFDRNLIRMGVPATRTHLPDVSVIEVWSKDAHAVRFKFYPDGSWAGMDVDCPTSTIKREEGNGG